MVGSGYSGVLFVLLLWAKVRQLRSAVLCGPAAKAIRVICCWPLHRQQKICCLEAFPQSGWQRQQLAGLTSFLGHQVVGGVTWGVDALALGPLLQQPEVLLWVARVLLQPGYLQGQH
jgi:hypothetical protein